MIQSRLPGTLVPWISLRVLLGGVQDCQQLGWFGMQRLHGRGEIARILNDLAVSKHDHAFSVAGYVLIVSDDDHGNSLFFIELAKELHDFLSGAVISVAGR